MQNKSILVGYVGKDPKITISGDNKFAAFNLATSERAWEDKSGKKHPQRTEWHRIEVRNSGLAGVVEKFVKTGSKLYIEGINRTRTWGEGKRAQVVSVEFGHNIVLLDKAERNDPPEPSMDDMEREVGPLDDDIPMGE